LADHFVLVDFCGSQPPIDIKQLWADLKDWLSNHYKQLNGALRPGASPNNIEAVERVFGVTFPEEVKQFYLCHDGQTNESPELFNGLRFLPLEHVVGEWSAWEELNADSNTYELDRIPEPELISSHHVSC
jgi:cell wall assembly regulator SMI1